MPTVGQQGLAPSPPQAMSIREQIGYPDYILEERNKHLDEEYSNVSPSPSQGALKSPVCHLSQTDLPLNQPLWTKGSWLPGVGRGALSVTWPRHHVLGRL